MAHSPIAILVALPLLGACSGGGGQVSDEALPVPSDPGARYRLLEWRVMSNGHREAITRRDGPSGTSFSRREIDCDGRQSRHLRGGDTLAEARTDSASIGEMEDMVAGSISTDLSQLVCSKPAP